ncbi:MAG: tRNA pseudouridine(38-40) synthase TruA [Eubacteriales bacterium]
MKYLAKIRYLGVDFCGFQFQPKLRTVQGVLTHAAETLFGVPTAVSGCSRTDSGVHANQSCVSLVPGAGGACIPPDKLPYAMAPFLPYDLSLFEAREVPDSFHVRYDVVKKEYVYLVYHAPHHNPFWVGRAWHVPYPLLPDGLLRMRQAAGYLVGRQDYAAFMSAGSTVRDTTREVFSLTVAQEDGMTRVRITADGFLYNMVRIIVGTLVDVALGRLEPDELPDIVASHRRERAGETAPPDGLYLNRVFYPWDIIPDSAM